MIFRYFTKLVGIILEKIVFNLQGRRTKMLVISCMRQMMTNKFGFFHGC